MLLSVVSNPSDYLQVSYYVHTLFYRCSAGRGYRCPPHALINVTYGARAAQAKGLKTVDASGRQVVSSYVPTNKNSSKPVRTQPNTYSSPVRTQTGTYSSALSQADQAKEKNKVCLMT